MWRNVGVMLFIFVLPVIQVILFCLAIGRDPTGLHLAVVNHEMDWENKTCPINTNCTFSYLSCRYLNALPNETIIQDHYRNVDSAIKAVEVGDAWGALYFTDNFTDALVARMLLGRDADSETLDQSEIRVWLDMSNQQIGLMLNCDLQISYRDFAQELLKSCNQNPKLADIPIQSGNQLPRTPSENKENQMVRAKHSSTPSKIMDYIRNEMRRDERPNPVAFTISPVPSSTTSRIRGSGFFRKKGERL